VGYRVKAYDNLPDIQQIDLFRLSMVVTNSIIISDTLNKELEIKNINYSKLFNYDWSEKFVQGSEVIENNLSTYAQTNNLEYDNDTTVNSRLGRASFAVTNEALKDEQTFIKLDYGASNEVEISSNTIAHFEVYTDTVRANDELNKRLVYVYNDAGNVYTLARFLNIDWNTLITDYYGDFVNSVSRLRYVEALFNLNKLDVLGFDFGRTVYIEPLKATFIVLAIEDFVPDSLTRVKMLKFR